MSITTSRNLYAHNESHLLRCVADIGQTNIGLAIGHDKSYVSRLFSGEGKAGIDEFLKMLDVCGLRISAVTDEEVTLPKSEHDALVTFATKAINSYSVKAK